MITSDTPARMACDHDRCEEHVRVRLLLMPTGGFIPDVPAHAHGWSLLIDPKNMAQPYRAYCPLHANAEKSRIVTTDTRLVA